MFGFSLAFTSPPFRLSPALQLYFAGATTLDSRITFTRADAVTCATYFDSTGRLQTMGRNELLWSEDLLNAVWTTRTNCAAVQGATAPDGTATAWTITASGTNAAYQQVIVGSATTAYTSSMWVRRKSGSGTVAMRAAELAGTTISVTSTWTRFSVTNTSTTTTIRCAILMTNADDAVEIWHPQLEKGSTATSYSATTTAANSGPRFDYDPATPIGTGPNLWTGATIFADGTVTATGPNVTFSGSPSAASAGQTASVSGGGRTYAVTYTITDYVSGNVRFILYGNGCFGISASRSANGTYTDTIRIDSSGGSFTDQFRVQTQAAGTTLRVTNISIQEVTFNPRGLLIEESRQNLLSQSNAWNNNGGASVATSTQNAVGIDGGATSAWTITESATSGNQYSVSSVGVITAAVHTVSAFVKAGTKNIVQLCVPSVLSTDYANFTLSGDGTVNQATTLANCSIRNVGGGWYRIAMTFTAAAGSGGAVVTMINATTDVRLPVYTGTSKTVIVFGAQIELGSFPTSYIVTTGTALTRAADSASMTGTNFSSWFNASAGTFVAEANLQTSSADLRLYMARNTGSTNSIAGRRTVANNVAALFRFPTNYDITSTSFTTGILKHALAYDSTLNGLAFNGGAASTGASATPPSDIDRLFFGTDGNGFVFLNGHIRSLRYYPTRLPNATLQALTA